MSARELFRAAWRVARLTPHKNAAAAAMLKLPDDSASVIVLEAALHCWLRRRDWTGGVQAIKNVRRMGVSGSKCKEISLRAVRYRRATGWKFGKGGFARWERRAFA